VELWDDSFMSCGVGFHLGEFLGILERCSFKEFLRALKEKKRPFLDIGAIPAELKKMIGGCWNEDAKDRPVFVLLSRELCIGEFEEMSSHLKQLSLGGSPYSSQGLFVLFFPVFLSFGG